jgi:acid phosphatase type 7
VTEAPRAWWTRSTVGVVAMMLAALAAMVAAVLVRSGPTPPAEPPMAAPVPPAPTGDVVLVAAGDIACPSDEQPRDDACQQAATADLVEAVRPALVLTLGDNQYPSGELAEFERSYDATWGRFKSITRPAIGNHETQTPDAHGYFTYFGAAAGNPATGYYSFDAGSWHVISLNTECHDDDCLEPGSAQDAWLRADLADNRARCVLAYMHRPRFSSDDHHGNATQVTDLWQALYDGGADVVLAGHAHSYERFAPQTPDGELDLDRGLRSFVVGTGGRSLYGLGDKQPNSELFYNGNFGVLRMTLRPDGYSWEFMPIDGGTGVDSGSDTCRGP